MRRVMSFCSILPLLAMMGCGGGGSDVKFGDVTGSVKSSKGEPLNGGNITFVVLSGPDKGTKFTTDINPDGTFSKSRVRYGDYGVQLFTYSAKDLSELKKHLKKDSDEYKKYNDIKPYTLSEKYKSAEKSGLTLKVDQENVPPLNIELKDK